jgi:DNA polymerase-4
LLTAAVKALDAAVPDGRPIRLLGVGFTNLTDYDQLTLRLDDAPEPRILGAVDDDPNEDVALPAPLQPNDAHPGVDVEVAGRGAGWIVKVDESKLVVRLEGPDTPPGRDYPLLLGRDEILRTSVPPVSPIPRRAFESGMAG